MKLGIITFDYRLAFGKSADCRLDAPAMDTLRFIDRVAELGLDGFMWEGGYMPAIEDPLFDKVREKAEAHGLYVEVAGGGVRLESMERWLAAAKKLNAAVIRTDLGTDHWGKCNMRFKKSRETLQEELKAKGDMLRKSVKLAEKHKIKIALENHADFSADELVSLIKAIGSEYVGACLDTGNGLALMDSPMDDVRKLAPYAFAVHLKDYAIMHSGVYIKIFGVPLGQGALDLPQMMRIIRDKAPNPNITIECGVEARGTVAESLKYEDDTVRESVRYARETLNIK